MSFAVSQRALHPHGGALRPPPLHPLAMPPVLLARAPLLPGLRPIESQRIESGAWFAGLSAGLRAAILGEARVQHVKRGERLLARGDVATEWVGVASGALGLATSWRDGRAFTMELLSPGDWYGDIALIDHCPVDLDIVAQVQSTVLTVPLAGLQQLLNSHPELRHALLQLDCRRLRHMFRRLEELQTLPLSQRVAIKLQRLLKQFGRPPVMGVVPTEARLIELSLTQGDLAALLCASRQRINGVLRQLQALGVLGGSHGRIEVLLPQKLADVANGKLVLDTSNS